MRRIGWRRAAGAVVLVAATGLVGGCGGDSAGDKAGEKLAEQALEDAGEDVDVDIDGDEVTIEGEDGTVKVGSGEVPDAFPDELSIVDGDVLSSVDTPDGAMVTVASDDAVAAFDQAVADLEANGWTKQQVTETGESRLAMYSKGDQSAMVVADGTTGQVTYTIGAG
ncbi:hypothetical protein J2X46_000961 [Nocardioides sp. BE266]|uniref:hypothetical protein n=1 Tax=Nocardioides sp. BE266 TaxID=2817725 RepID=UPI002858ACDC|nr:hypothetical protein [Nocardioides sp. BE266]MDR7251985.1 hypothetical protein [Nocardioides sp. BE266]